MFLLRLTILLAVAAILVKANGRQNFAAGKAQDNAQSPTKFDLQKRPPGSKRNAPGRNGGTKGVGRKKNPKSGTNDGSGKLNRQTRYAAVDPHAGRMRQVNRNKKPTSKLTRSKTPQFKQGSNKTPQKNQVRPPKDMMPADAPYLEQKAAPSAARAQTFRYRLRKNRKGKEICVNTETKKVVKMRICEMLFGKSATAKESPEQSPSIEKSARNLNRPQKTAAAASSPMQNDASHMESSSPLPRIDVAQANSSTTSATGAKKSRRSQPFFQMVTINGTRKCINKLSKKRVYMGKCDPTYKKAPNKKIRSANSTTSESKQVAADKSTRSQRKSEEFPIKVTSKNENGQSCRIYFKSNGTRTRMGPEICAILDNLDHYDRRERDGCYFYDAVMKTKKPVALNFCDDNRSTHGFILVGKVTKQCRPSWRPLKNLPRYTDPMCKIPANPTKEATEKRDAESSKLKRSAVETSDPKSLPIRITLKRTPHVCQVYFQSNSTKSEKGTHVCSMLNNSDYFDRRERVGCYRHDATTKEFRKTDHHFCDSDLKHGFILVGKVTKDCRPSWRPLKNLPRYTDPKCEILANPTKEATEISEAESSKLKRSAVETSDPNSLPIRITLKQTPHVCRIYFQSNSTRSGKGTHVCAMLNGSDYFDRREKVGCYRYNATTKEFKKTDLHFCDGNVKHAFYNLGKVTKTCVPVWKLYRKLERFSDPKCEIIENKTAKASSRSKRSVVLEALPDSLNLACVEYNNLTGEVLQSIVPCENHTTARFIRLNGQCYRKKRNSTCLEKAPSSLRCNVPGLPTNFGGFFIESRTQTCAGFYGTKPNIKIFKDYDECSSALLEKRKQMIKLAASKRYSWAAQNVTRSRRSNPDVTRIGKGEGKETGGRLNRTRRGAESRGAAVLKTGRRTEDFKSFTSLYENVYLAFMKYAAFMQASPKRATKSKRATNVGNGQEYCFDSCGIDVDRTQFLDGYRLYKRHIRKDECNPITEFRCRRTGECFTYGIICNGYDDCSDKSDEPEETCGVRACTDDEYECDDGKCYDMRFKCDSTYDCQSLEDEEDGTCSTAETDEETLTENLDDENLNSCEFRCKDGSCLPKKFVCDATQDCEDNSDEENCEPITCQSGYWQCHNRLQCIEQNAKCDGNDDCYDASDEENCPVTSKNVEAVTKRMPDIGLPPYQGPGGSNENSPKQPSMELLKGKETDGPQYISTSKETPSPETELTTELPPATELTTELQSATNLPSLMELSPTTDPPPVIEVTTASTETSEVTEYDDYALENYPDSELPSHQGSERPSVGLGDIHRTDGPPYNSLRPETISSTTNMPPSTKLTTTPVPVKKYLICYKHCSNPYIEHCRRTSDDCGTKSHGSCHDVTDEMAEENVYQNYGSAVRRFKFEDLENPVYIYCKEEFKVCKELGSPCEASDDKCRLCDRQDAYDINRLEDPKNPMRNYRCSFDCDGKHICFADDSCTGGYYCRPDTLRSVAKTFGYLMSTLSELGWMVLDCQYQENAYCEEAKNDYEFDGYTKVCPRDIARDKKMIGDEYFVRECIKDCSGFSKCRKAKVADKNLYQPYDLYREDALPTIPDDFDFDPQESLFFRLNYGRAYPISYSECLKLGATCSVCSYQEALNRRFITGTTAKRIVTAPTTTTSTTTTTPTTTTTTRPTTTTSTTTTTTRIVTTPTTTTSTTTTTPTTTTSTTTTPTTTTSTSTPATTTTTTTTEAPTTAIPAVELTESPKFDPSGVVKWDSSTDSVVIHETQGPNFHQPDPRQEKATRPAHIALPSYNSYNPQVVKVKVPANFQFTTTPPPRAAYQLRGIEKAAPEYCPLDPAKFYDGRQRCLHLTAFYEEVKHQPPKTFVEEISKLWNLALNVIGSFFTHSMEVHGKVWRILTSDSDMTIPERFSKAAAEFYDGDVCLFVMTDLPVKAEKLAPFITFCELDRQP